MKRTFFPLCRVVNFRFPCPSWLVSIWQSVTTDKFHFSYLLLFGQIADFSGLGEQFYICRFPAKVEVEGV